MHTFIFLIKFLDDATANSLATVDASRVQRLQSCSTVKPWIWAVSEAWQQMKITTPMGGALQKKDFPVAMVEISHLILPQFHDASLQLHNLVVASLERQFQALNFLFMCSNLTSSQNESKKDIATRKVR